MRETTKRKLVIINADDFGFSPGVTEGILQAHRGGIVTSTTITINMPAAEESLSRLAEASRLGIGVHLNVTQGPPLSADGGALAGRDGLMNRTAAQLFRAILLAPRLLDAVEAECDAQVRRLIAGGRQPTHLDSHRHVHAFRPIFLRVARVARRYDIPFVRFCREVLPGGRWPPADRSQRRTARLLNVFGSALGVLGRDLRGTQGTWGVAHTGRIDVAWLKRAAGAIRPGAWEIMTHPGLGDDLDAAATRLRESRRAELDALCDPAVREAFERHGIERVHYGRL